MNKKFSKFEIFYYFIAIYCLWSSQDLFLATVKFQGTHDVSILDSSLFLVGAFVPITTMTSSLPIPGAIVGIFILVSPLLGAILYHDYKKKWVGVLCIILTMMVTSQVVTGTYYSPMAGLGGLIAPLVVVTLLLIGLLAVVRDEIKRELKTIISKDNR